MKLTDSQIQAICEQEISAASNSGGELANERATALDYYLGEPYGDEKDGRSQIVTREVLETVEWIVPSLVRIFCDAENLVVFEPVGPEDEPQAEQESDVVSYVYWKQNNGFYNTLTFIKDALLSKTGVLKVWWEEAKSEEVEEYTKLSDVQLAQLMNDPIFEREPMSAELNEDGSISATFKTKRRNGCVRIEPVAPENFGVENHARTPYAKDCGFVWHRELKTYADLVDMGIDQDTIERIPPDDDGVLEEEELARRNLTDETNNYGASSDKSRRSYWVTECYIKLDANDDGVPELLKVTLASGSTFASGSVLLDKEEVDAIPFFTASPILLTHKFYGLSIADMTMDIQRIKSALLRNILDNAYLANNSRTAVNDEYVNLDDVLTSRPGGVIRYKGEGAASQYVMPIPNTPLPTETFGLLEYLDEQRKQRVGAGDDVAGLDKASLGQVNTGVFALAYDAARMKIEQIARTLAEIGLKPLFERIHELLQKHQDQAATLKLRNSWVPVNPGDWRTRENSTVMVGVGQVTKERKLMALDAVMMKQQGLAAAGAIGTLILPEQIYQAHKDYVSAWGLEPDLYFQDPRKLPPPPPPQPDPQTILMDRQGQAMMIDAQAKLESAKVKQFQVETEAQLKQADMALRAREIAANLQLEGLKSEMARLKSDTDSAGKVASIAGESQKRQTEESIKRLQLELDHVAAERDRMQREIESSRSAAIEVAKLEIQAGMQTNQAKPDDSLARAVADIQRQLSEMQQPKPPRKYQVVRDGDGLVLEIKEA